MTKWYVDVSPRVKSIVFSHFVTLMLVVVTLEIVGQLLKSYKVGSFGPLCLEMLTNSISVSYTHLTLPTKRIV